MLFAGAAAGAEAAAAVPGAGLAKRTVQTALSRAEGLGIIKRAIGGGRTLTTSYLLV